MTATAIASIAAAPAHAQEQAASSAAQEAPASDEASQAITDSVTRFTLPNGLKVVVQSSHRVPLVSAALVYDVGSKDERAGQYGYAHLFEHLALDGSAHWNQNALRSLHDMGATQINAQTTRDSTTFLETFPRAALERVLFLEADRMGFIGAALTSERIAREVDVVLNEKSLRAGQPFGTVDAVIHRDMYPVSHPYHHNVVGNEADLRGVTVAAARQWFDTYYGPSNATLILAGDVTGDDARELVTRYFGGLEPRPAVDTLQTQAPRMSGPVRRQMFDAVAGGRLYVNHLAPPAGSAAIAELDLTAQIMANGPRSRLSRLVSELGLARSAFATFEIGKLSSVMGFVVDGVDPEDMPRVEDEVDAMLARFAAEGPTSEELENARTARIGYLRNLQNSTSGKAFLQAQGAKQNQVADFAESYLRALSSATVDSVRRVATDIYGRPGHHLSVLPRPALRATIKPHGYDLAAGPPPLGPITPIAFPAIEDARLSNGLRVVLVPREGSLPTRCCFGSRKAAMPARRARSPGSRSPCWPPGARPARNWHTGSGSTR
ncbi:pitrilysin family protein [Croceicoccus sp. YJ47]|uniref:M16 family metallopeptidase n=1 Tax=Croceicoccus sp. YJ47 TaxID=2798724 RepID=UPI001922D2C6|nr:pitrilysin family protein [Croceicoccus sp. YJ47]QQN74728.1 insulinase family protein [Croceicoccus sp. YJ47]